MKRTYLFLFPLILFAYLAPVNSYAQEWDYEQFPRTDIELTHLDAELKIEADGSVQGDILYTATLKNSFSDSIFFDEAGLDIEAITIDGLEVDFVVQDLKLVIIPDEIYPRGAEIELGIRYSGKPSFGVHRSASGTVWTSFLPRSTRHWLPVIDSPRTQFLSNFIITHPAGTVIAANGRKGASQVVDTEYEQTSFITNSPVSASALSWALFTNVNTVSTAESEEIRNSYRSFSRRSDPQIAVYSEAEENLDDILLVAAQKVQQISDETDTNFLNDDLHIMILENDFMETKNFGNGMLFVYRNKGDLRDQVERGIVSLFAESLVKAASWSDADAARLTEAFFINRFSSDGYFDHEASLQPYSVYSSKNLKRWQLFLESDNSNLLREGLEVLLQDLPEQRPIVSGWQQFSRQLHEITGISWHDGLELPELEPETQDTIYTYSAAIDWEEGSTSAEVRFEAADNPINELVTVVAEVIGLRESREIELTFSGTSDGVVLNVPSALDNIKLTVQNRDDVLLRAEKPFLFWMFQLRNDESEEKRAEAALGISSYSDDPDIELLLNDMLRGEESDIVIANILTAMSVITNGAAGTDERFLQYAGSQQPQTVRLAAVEALGNYSGNERIISRLQSIIRQESADTLQITALRSLNSIVDAQQMVDISNSFIEGDIVPKHIPILLEMVSDNGSEEQAVELADKALRMEIPYGVIQEIVRFLVVTDESASNWQSRLSMLMNSPHPGVRLEAAEAVEKLSPTGRIEFIETVLPNEFDERVRRKLRQI
jgi:hypothetical protein